jgi:hypothetical protein
VALKAIAAVLEIGFGPPSKEANEELAVWGEAAGIDMDELAKKAAKALSDLKSRY